VAEAECRWCQDAQAAAGYLSEVGPLLAFLAKRLYQNLDYSHVGFDESVV
jgi:hypothetical protein